MVRASVTRTSRVQFVCAVAHTGPADIVGGDFIEHAPASRCEAPSGRLPGHQPIAALPIGSEHWIWRAREGLPGRADAPQQRAAGAGSERGGSARGEAGGARNLRRDVPRGEVAQARGGAGVPILGRGTWRSVGICGLDRR